MLSCTKSYSNKIDEEFRKRLKNALINEYMDEWNKCNKISLPEKENFYSNLNMEDITNADYVHAKRICKDFEIKHLGQYHDLCLKSNILLLPDVFENFRKNKFRNL